MQLTHKEASAQRNIALYTVDLLTRWSTNPIIANWAIDEGFRAANRAAYSLMDRDKRNA